MLVFRMLCRITQSSDAHRTESVSVMDHEQTMEVNSGVLDQKQQTIFGRISLFWSVELQGHPEQLNGGDHDSYNAERVGRRHDSSENQTKFKFKFSDVPLSPRSFKDRRNYYITTQFDELQKQYQYRPIFSVISALLRTAKIDKIWDNPNFKGDPTLPTTV